MNTDRSSASRICIVGAGPGGAGAALRLSYLGIPCTLIDKAVFPRDKICGDAISGKVTTLLNRLDPAIMERFQALAGTGHIDVWGMHFVAPNGKGIGIPFKPNFRKGAEPAPGYVSKRIDFDHFLVDEVKRRDSIRFWEGLAVTGYERTDTGYRVLTADPERVIDCQLLLVADGAQSGFSRKQAGLEKDPAHHAGAVRAYYRNVKGLHPDNFIELHFLQDVLPGYFWIFPLPNGYANVGLGMRTDYLSKRKVNLRAQLETLVREHPTLRERFEGATLEGKVIGYGLPLGSKKRVLSGDHYLLLGDAGHLVDPLTGEGIGNALYSGFIAAELAEKCLETHNFSAAFLRAYDVRVARVLGQEMQLSYRVQRLLRYPWLINRIAGLVQNNRRFLDTMSSMYTDFELRKQLINPLFWLRFLRKKQP